MSAIFEALPVGAVTWASVREVPKPAEKTLHQQLEERGNSR